MCELRENPMQVVLAGAVQTEADLRRRCRRAAASVRFVCGLQQGVAQLKRKVRHFFSGIGGDF